MTQNANTVTRGEDLPQILPLIMEMELQRKYILAGILKVDIMYYSILLFKCNISRCYLLDSIKKFSSFKLDAEKPYHELLTETRNLFELGFVKDDDRRRIQDAFSDLHLKAIRRYIRTIFMQNVNCLKKHYY